VSLDYIFVKARALVDSIAELEQDSAFGLRDYQVLGSKLFSGIHWQTNHNTAIINFRDFDVELSASTASLSARLCGEGADPELIYRLAGLCRENSVVIVDAQTSELLTAKGNEESAAKYVAWYRSILRQISNG
jgi:hypothetical protein